jgi:hypothetical protein
MVIYIRFSPKLQKESSGGREGGREGEQKTRVEAWSNTATVTLRVVGGDEKGSLESETVKYGLEFQGTRTRDRLSWQGPAAYTETDRSSRQRGRSAKTIP